MSAPIADGGSVLVALGIGVAFGWTLERAGLGSARKLMGQFYFTDLTVFKVMFSAIVTAMLGTFWLAQVGVLDLSRVYVPETFITPQLVGGLVFGVGFALAGLCPGTSCVAAATGRGDGAAVVAGMLSGVLTTGIGFTLLHRFYESGARGSFTLPQLFVVPRGFVTFAIVVIAVMGFLLAERLERRTATIGSMGRRGASLAITAVILGSLAAIAPPSDATADGRISAVDVAGWIKDRRPALRIVDVRSTEAFDDYHIPTAIRAPLGSTGAPPAAFDAPIVVYADTPAHGRDASSALTARGYRRVSYLPGGVTDWLDQVMNASLPRNASPEAKAAFAKARELCLFFGGVPRVDVDPTDRPASVQQVRRRGC
jgi:uncharacterized protein